jgi:hypothetical protein
MPIRPGAVALIGALLQLSACANDTEERPRYTLYRNSVTDTLARYHVASFDASDGDRYNQENCEVARQLFQAQPGVSTRFWCEKGRFRP